MSPYTRHSQRGATLVVALIMLVLLTLFALSAMNTSNISLKIANNMQTRSDAFNAAQQAIERLASYDFTKNTAAVTALVPTAVDVNNDGVPDYDVVLPVPTCIATIPIKQSELDPSVNPEDSECYISSKLPGSLIISKKKGTSGGNSNCSNSKWDLSASATDPISKATVTVHQGIGVRVAFKGATC